MISILEYVPVDDIAVSGRGTERDRVAGEVEGLEGVGGREERKEIESR